MCPHERVPGDESFCEGHLRLGAELRVAALDELLKPAEVSRVATASGPAGVNCVAWQASARRFVS